MATFAEFTIIAKWKSVEPDGSECSLCGDRCYLGQMSLIAPIGRQLVDLNTPLCIGCSELVNEEDCDHEDPDNSGNCIKCQLGVEEREWRE